jgi:hypothetical protein
MKNALLDESRDARLKLSVEGFCDTLRAPESLHRLLMLEKPAAVSTGDFALRAMLNESLMAHMVRGDYRAIQRLLGTLFGDEVPPGTVAASRVPIRPLAKVAAR